MKLIAEKKKGEVITMEKYYEGVAGEEEYRNRR